MHRAARCWTPGPAILVLAAALGAWPQPAAACSCLQTSPAGPRPCRSFAEAGAVFVGHAVDVAAVGSPWGEGRLYRMAVEEAFAGVDSSTVEILTGTGQGDCGVQFRLGESVLVYAERRSEDGPLEAWACGGYLPLSYAAADLEYARRRVRGEDVPGIFGIVGLRQRPSLSSGARVEPLPDVAVTVTGREPREVRVRTDAEGYFEVAGDLAGVYEVRADLPGAPALTVEVPHGGCAEASPVVVETGRLEGVVLTAAGEPSPGTEVILLTEGEPDSREWATTDETGSFVFPEVPAGRFLVAVNPEAPPFPKDPLYRALYYPAAGDAASATTVAVAAGATVALEPMVLGEPLATRKISGRVSWADGRPIGLCIVSIARLGGDGPRRAAGFDPDGRFELTVYFDGTYLVSASNCGSSADGSATVLVEPGDEDVTVKLILETAAGE